MVDHQKIIDAEIEPEAFSEQNEIEIITKIDTRKPLPAQAKLTLMQHYKMIS